MQASNDDHDTQSFLLGREDSQPLDVLDPGAIQINLFSCKQEGNSKPSIEETNERRVTYQRTVSSRQSVSSEDNNKIQVGLRGESPAGFFEQARIKKGASINVFGNVWDRQNIDRNLVNKLLEENMNQSEKHR